MSLTALASDSFMVASIDARVGTVRTDGGQILGGGSGEFLLPYIDIPNRGEYLNIEIEGDSIRITNEGISIEVDVPKLKATNYVDLNAVVTNADRYSQESYVVTLAVDELKLLLSSYGKGEIIRFCKTGPGQLVDTQIVHTREGELDTRVLLMGANDPEYQKR